ncbi:AAA family ATPase [Methylorubrum populi]|uniref:AAA family ATPase n=1 Tax=Methylorubrum rhodesianum TaxID=29427 RepID=A0ABU9Z531_9HYPH|nr:AAA family ATPase [Methylorubrum rhodesianum]MBK3403668.1 AAA family ATPase [Methylorubrum rhodesianum]MBY0144156.1 AAA family ATPase [Methylorubrum populi]
MVGATVLVGLALASKPQIFRAILDGSPVVSLEVPDDGVEPVSECIRICFGPRKIRDGRPKRGILPERPADRRPGSRKGAVVVGVDKRNRRYGSPEGSKDAAAAIRDLQPLIGVASSPRRDLPGDLLRACEHRIVLGRFDPPSIALVIEEVVGGAPSRQCPSDIAAAADLTDLRLGIHRRRGADGSLDRLEALVRPRLCAMSGGPGLEDLAGYGQAQDLGLTAAADLQAFRRGEIGWSECDRGILLAGPPGVGKTMFARALATTAGLPFIAGSLAQWQSAGEGHLGSTLAAMQAFFEQARRQAPIVALTDELDSFGDRRRFSASHRDYAIQVVNGFLECLDGTVGRDGVFLVGASNFPEAIDPAIVRSGRFERVIAISLPSAYDIAAILRHHLGSDLADLDLTDTARRCVGSTGADCAAWVRRARGDARRAGRAISADDLLRAIGMSSAHRTEPYERRIALHEAGHAVTAYALGIPVRAIALNNGMSENAGFTVCDAKFDDGTRSYFEKVLTALLAGRAAEILVLGAPSAGATADLARATQLAYRLEHEWGLGSRLSNFGAVDGRSVNSSDGSARHTLECILRSCEECALDILASRRAALEAVASALIDRRWLDEEELEQLLATTSAADERSLETPGHGSAEKTR